MYTDEKNVQILIALLKMHGIRKVIASPGSANSPLVAGLQIDSHFEMYSSVDERSAAYMACGLSAESGEPVVISCTGATASRNYLPALTEAFYRHLPILAITSTQAVSRVGHHMAQVIDRSSLPNDVVKLSVTLPIIKDQEDQWDCEIKVNRAILELKRNGGGPAHINLSTNSLRTYDTRKLPTCRKIQRIDEASKFPEIARGRVAVFIGSHAIWSKQETEALENFCASNNAVVFCDHTSNYKGNYRVLSSILACQQMLKMSAFRPETLIHIGEISGDYYSSRGVSGKQVWRVSKDGEIRDTFRRLRYVFEMDERTFFERYSKSKRSESNDYWNECMSSIEVLNKKIPELPFSNIWIASKIAHRIPSSSVVHFGILNSLRSWNFFEMPSSISSSSNVGGFGIDGGISTLVGASLAQKDKLYFGIIGDLAFFYDMNALGNRHVNRNLRILLVNNGRGTEFKNYNHHTSHFGDRADEFIAASGHFGNKSMTLVRHYAEDLGFEYLSATNKEEFEQGQERFIVPELTEKPMLFEVFTDSAKESKALEIMMNLEEKGKAKKTSGFQRISKALLSGSLRIT
jgi:2-succinyl-5-enolpyruvyl-6-hydroxy-3-cyclohexene-1-carboxylate synthase